MQIQPKRNRQKLQNLSLFGKYAIYLAIAVFSGISCKKKPTLVLPYTTYTVADGFPINSTYWLSNSIGLACGGEKSSSGKIYRTTDGGTTWAQVSNTDFSLYDVCFVNDTVGYCGGEKFNMLYTTNAGQTWQTYKFDWAPGGYNHSTLRNLNKINNRVMVTGGDNFNIGIMFQFSYNDFSYGYSIQDSELRGSLDFNNGDYYFFGYGYGFVSSDSLRTHTPIKLTNDFFTGTCAVNNSLAYVCGYNGGIYKTKNAGQDWEKINATNNLVTARSHFTSIFFSDVNNGWCVGDEGLILNTTNGSDWKKIDYSGKENFLSVRKKSGSSVIVSTSEGKLLEFN